jgi:8-oxo-dGTP pyrophosphatase MutT (NUDIX family)
VTERQRTEDGVRWIVHGERSLYDSEWVNLRLVDVEIPGERRFEHHVVRFSRPAAGVIVHDPARGVLLLWRHRFITDTWGWEVPAGKVERGETLEHGAAREVLEETGWRPGPLRHLVSFHPANGVSDQLFHIFVAEGAIYVGDPLDPSESERVEWLPIQQVRELIRRGEIRDGLSLAAMATALATGALG